MESIVQPRRRGHQIGAEIAVIFGQHDDVVKETTMAQRVVDRLFQEIHPGGFVESTLAEELAEIRVEEKVRIAAFVQHREDAQRIFFPIPQHRGREFKIEHGMLGLETLPSAAQDAVFESIRVDLD